MVSRDRTRAQLTNRRGENRLRRFKAFMIFLGTLLVAFFPPPYAEGLDISDVPLEVKILSAPPNIMFVLDNSGSMDWEFITDDTDGKFEGNIEYLFDDPGDNNYKPPDSNGSVLPVAKRG